MCGKPVFQLLTPRIPTSWWLRPVSSDARVGEHSGVTWKFVYRRPFGREAVDVRRVDRRAVATEVGEPEVVDEDDDDVRRVRRRGAAARTTTAWSRRASARSCPRSAPARPCRTPSRRDRGSVGIGSQGVNTTAGAGSTRLAARNNPRTVGCDNKVRGRGLLRSAAMSETSRGHAEHIQAAERRGLPGAMPRPVKVTMLGAGSMFTPELAKDLFLDPRPRGRHDRARRHRRGPPRHDDEGRGAARRRARRRRPVDRRRERRPHARCCPAPTTS